MRADLRRSTDVGSTFSLSTWSSSYPLCVFALLLGQLGKDFDSPALRVLNTAFTIIVLGASCAPSRFADRPGQWLYLVARTIPLAVTGALFLSGVDDEDQAPAERKPHKLQSRENTKA